MAIVAIDPGREKCGMAVLSEQGEVLRREVVETGGKETWLRKAAQDYEIRAIVLGNGTTSGAAAKSIESEMPDVELTLVDEYRTTEMARREYWRINPPRGWRALFPRSLLFPPEPVDDLVAVILGRRYLGGSSQ